MNDNTERLARELAEAVKSAPNGMFTPKVIANADHILATTTPQTMAEVEWDDEEHYLAEAEYIDCGKVIMLYRDEDDGLIQCQIIGGKHSAFFAYSGNLTPTGRRFTLTETTND